MYIIIKKVPQKWTTDHTVLLVIRKLYSFCTFPSMKFPKFFLEFYFDFFFVVTFDEQKIALKNSDEPGFLSAFNFFIFM